MCGNRKMDTTSFICNNWMVEYSLGMIMFLLLTYRFLSNWGEVMGWACYWVTKAWSVWSSATSVGWFLSLCVYACVFALFWLPPVKLLTPIVTKHTWRSIKVQDKAKQKCSVKMINKSSCSRTVYCFISTFAVHNMLYTFQRVSG